MRWSPIVAIAVVGAVVLWRANSSPAPFASAAEFDDGVETVASEPTFTCEGKTHCSHMTSCEEATFYIQNCPNTQMDGDGDGVPCERQFCGR